MQFCETVHLVGNFTARIQEQLPTRARRAAGGATPLCKSGLAGDCFFWIGAVAAARIGWIEVGCLSVHCSGLRLWVFSGVR